MPKHSTGRSSAAGRRAYNSVQGAKRHAEGAVFRALHRAESLLASALGLVRFPKRGKKNRRGPRKKKEGTTDGK